MSENYFGLRNFRISSPLEEYMREIGVQIFIEEGPPDATVNLSSVAHQYIKHISICVNIRGKQYFTSASTQKADETATPEKIVCSLISEYEIFLSCNKDLHNYYTWESVEYIVAAQASAERMTKFLESNLAPNELNKLRALVNARW